MRFMYSSSGTKSTWYMVSSTLERLYAHGDVGTHPTIFFGGSKFTVGPLIIESKRPNLGIA